MGSIRAGADGNVGAQFHFLEVLMLTQIFPQDSRRYLSLPLLGPLMDRYAGWLQEQRYTWRSTRYELRMAAHAAAYLKRRAVRRIEDLSAEHLAACHLLFGRKFPEEAGSVHVLARFLHESGFLKKSAAPPPRPVDTLAGAFMAHLRDVRGYAASTIRRQGGIVAEFLTWLRFEEAPDRLASLRAADLEGFVRHLGRRMGRVGLQKPIATMRSFLRFLAAEGLTPAGLDGMIDTPRVYRQEQLPRSLPWSTVESFLGSIKRDSAIGKRDYAIFSLIATYGLRACDVVAVTLDDIQWRDGRFRIRQSKTGHSLEFP